MARVPYRNPQDATNDVATQRIQVAEASLATLRPQLQAGSIKLLATTNSTRAPSNPKLRPSRKLVSQSSRWTVWLVSSGRRGCHWRYASG
jgi:hypothetical protein